MLENTLNFATVCFHRSQVDFNAGVVAAGEAQIESTVTGNASTASISERVEALKDQSQIYLPINNALAKVGWVVRASSHMFQNTDTYMDLQMHIVISDMFMDSFKR